MWNIHITVKVTNPSSQNCQHFVCKLQSANAKICFLLICIIFSNHNTKYGLIRRYRCLFWSARLVHLHVVDKSHVCWSMICILHCSLYTLPVEVFAQQTLSVGPMLVWRCPIVFDADPTSAQHWTNASCLLDTYWMTVFCIRPWNLLNNSVIRELFWYGITFRYCLLLEWDQPTVSMTDHYSP